MSVNTAASRNEVESRAEAQSPMEQRRLFFQSLKKRDTIEVTQFTGKALKKEKVTRGVVVQSDPKLITYSTGNYKLSVSLNDYLMRGYDIKKIEEAGEAGAGSGVETKDKPESEPKTEPQSEPRATSSAKPVAGKTSREGLESLWREKGNVFDVAEALDMPVAQIEALLARFGIMDGQPVDGQPTTAENEDKREEELAQELTRKIEHALEQLLVPDIEGQPPEEKPEAEEEKEVEGDRDMGVLTLTTEQARKQGLLPYIENASQGEPEVEKEIQPNPGLDPPARPSAAETEGRKGRFHKKPVPSTDLLQQAYDEEKSFSGIARRFGVSIDLAKVWLLNAGIIEGEIPKAYRHKERSSAAPSKETPSSPSVDTAKILARLANLAALLVASKDRDENILLLIKSIGNWATMINQNIDLINQTLARMEQERGNEETHFRTENTYLNFADKPDKAKEDIVADFLQSLALLLGSKGERGGAA
jgi:hypothetical protein